jgi:hypothetical protein
MRGEKAIEGRTAAGVGRIQQEIFEIHGDELDRAREFVTVRAAVAESVVRAAKAEPHRADLPAGEIEQARVARQLALRRAVIEMYNYVDDGRQRARVAGSSMPASAGRAIQPSSSARSSSSRAVHGRGPRGQVVTPFHSIRRSSASAQAAGRRWTASARSCCVAADWAGVSERSTA